MGIRARNTIESFPQRVHTSHTMSIRPITGMLRRGLVLDLSVAFGFGTSFGYAFWYGYHVPAVAKRDAYYSKLEDQRAAKPRHRCIEEVDGSTVNFRRQ